MNFYLEIDDELLEDAEKMEPNVRDLMNEFLSFHANMMLFSLSECESPIEKLMALALYARKNTDESFSDDGCYMIRQQEKIEVDGKVYRADFYINALFQGKDRKVLVECDGHDFHEKTKEQARRDKARDRALIKVGYEVIRFAGSEIFENPRFCARQVSEIVFK